jgi:hypothetical protein
MAVSYKTVYPSSMKQCSSCQLTVVRNPRIITIEQVGVVVTLSTCVPKVGVVVTLYTCVPKVVMFGLGRKTDSGFSFFFLNFLRTQAGIVPSLGQAFVVPSPFQ